MDVNNLIFVQIGQTETIIGNINPVFSRRCYISYCFENSQKLQCVMLVLYLLESWFFFFFFFFIESYAVFISFDYSLFNVMAQNNSFILCHY